MPLAIDRELGTMRIFTALFASLLVSMSLLSPAVQAADPRTLKAFSGSLDPGDYRSFSWNLYRDVSAFLFHYKITGPQEPLDVADVYIEEAVGVYWTLLMGEGWSYCECALDAGDYTVTVEADPDATDSISFDVGFYLVPNAPVDFAGFIPANSTYNRISDFGVFFASSMSYPIQVSAGPGSFEFFVDGESEGVVTSSQALTLDLTADLHFFEVVSLTVSAEEDVRWSVQIQGPPKLEVRILDACPVLNPESGQPDCTIGAEATASDGSKPNVKYLWTVNPSGGKLNSTSSQWVRWTAPPGVSGYTLTVRASAPDYVSDSDSLKVQVVPEFPGAELLLVFVSVLSLVVLGREKSRAQVKRW